MDSSLVSEAPFAILDSDYDHNLIVIKKFLEEQKNSYIVFIIDDKGNQYVVKQEKNPYLQRQYCIVSEAVSAYVAQSIGLFSQRVQIIPVGVPFPGKFITKRAATVHTFVVGDTIRSMAKSSNKYEKLDIKQDTDSSTPAERQGFNERTIFWMAQHPDLTAICAFDTFMSNPDRNKANTIRNEDDDHFYVIDMAGVYDIFSGRKSVSEIACQQVTLMIEGHKKFSQQELAAIIRYRETLKKLIAEFPPQRMIILFEHFFKQTRIVAGPLFSTQDIDKVLSAYKRAIKQSYVEVKRLAYLLLILIEDNKKG
jgi:hypothetical protein